jgi:hypothetical protein
MLAHAMHNTATLLNTAPMQVNLSCRPPGSIQTCKGASEHNCTMHKPPSTAAHVTRRKLVVHSSALRVRHALPAVRAPGILCCAPP